MGLPRDTYAYTTTTHISWPRQSKSVSILYLNVLTHHALIYLI